MLTLVDKKMAAAGDEQPNPDRQEITFDHFWEAWPRTRRLAKKQAEAQWRLIDQKNYPRILQAVAAFRETEQWKEKNGAFIPYAFRWLRDERWEDSVETDITMGQCCWNRNGNRGPEGRCTKPATTEKQNIPYCSDHSGRA